MEAGTGLGLEGSEQVTRGSLRRCQHSDLALAGQPLGGVKLPCLVLSPTPVWAADGRMNCRSEVLEVSVEGRQVEEAMLAVLHTVLLHRSTGKFHYKKEGTYSIGTVGTQDVDCDFIDFTYVRVSSEELDRALRKVVGEFKVGVAHAPRIALHPSSLLDHLTFPGCVRALLSGSKEQACSEPSGSVVFWEVGGAEGARINAKEREEGALSPGRRVPWGEHCPVLLTCSDPQRSLLAPVWAFATQNSGGRVAGLRWLPSSWSIPLGSVARVCVCLGRPGAKGHPRWLMLVTSEGGNGV